MKLLKAGAFALALLACAPMTAGCAGILHPSPSTQLTEAKALLVANTALDEAAKAVEAANNAGLLSPSEKQLIAGLLTKASAVLDVAGGAEAKGRDADVAAQLAMFAMLIGQISALVQGASA